MHHSGILSALAGRRLKRHVSVLTYHRVVDRARASLINSHPGIVISDSTFASHMKLLRREFNPISIDQLLESLSTSTPLPERSCLVTFDDGWLDNYEIAFPVLQEFEIPATIFLPVDYISNDTMFWQEETLMRLSWLRENGLIDDLSNSFAALDLKYNGDMPSDEDFNRLIGALKLMGDDDVNVAVDRIRNQTTSATSLDHYNRYMSWEQVQTMSAAGITFASHAKSHRILTKLPDDRCKHEIDSSRHTLEQRLNRPVRAIAYPNGDYDGRVLEYTKAAGYLLGFGTQQGLFRPGDNPLTIPRLNIHDGNASTEPLFINRCVNLI